MYDKKSIAKPEGYDSNIKYNGVPKKLKKAILNRDNYTCQCCGISKDELAKYIPGMETKVKWTIDHELPRRFGGSDDPSNLQCFCSECNTIKGDFFTNEEVKEKVIMWKDIKNNLIRKYVIISLITFITGFIIAFIATLVIFMGGIV